jgi:diguanylate cyclase (GGDEF)-like protein/PAS domain S-box-containing protein
MGDIRDPAIYRTILDSIQTGVYFVDRNRRILFWNAGAERITGYQRHEVVGHLSRENILATCNDQGCESCGASCPFSTTLLEGKSKEANVHLHHKTGHHIAVHAWLTPIRDEHGSVLGAAASFDVLGKGVARIRQKGAFANHACLDEATGVPNQSFSNFHLRENLAGFAEYQVPFSIIVVHIERFDHHKAAFGHEAMISILDAVVESIRNSIRPTDFLGRWAEDQFLVIALNCTTNGLVKLTERMRKIFGRLTLHWWGDELSVTTRLGTASVQTGDTPETLIQRALGGTMKDAAAPPPPNSSITLVKTADSEG